MKIPQVRCRLVRERGPWRDAPNRLRGPADVARFGSRILGAEPQECFLAVHLSAQHTPLSWEIITRGILDASLVHPREVFRGAIKASAGAVILIHNHPSGDPRPPAEDRAVTRQLSEAGKLLGVPVVDHVVVGSHGRFASLAEEIH